MRSNIMVLFDIKLKHAQFCNKMDHQPEWKSSALKIAFPDWKRFAEGFYASMSPSSVPVLTYEELQSEEVTDLDMVSGLLAEGYDPQEGLEAVIGACLLVPRYLHEIFDSGSLGAIVDAFVIRGASVAPLVGRLFDTRCGDMFDATDLLWAEEDVAVRARAKGMLIDVVARYDVARQAIHTADWPSIHSSDWEELPEELCRHCTWKMQLKYCSKYLQTL